MSSVNVTGIQVLNNPARFVDNFQFEITFECIKELEADLEWKLTYVGSAESEECDQVLDSVLVGPVPLGVNRFVFETPPPNHNKIPKQDLIGVTVCLISCLYKNNEFIRIGYYVNNEYDDPAAQVIENSNDEGMDIDESEGEEEEEEDEEEGDEEDKAFVEKEEENNNGAGADPKASSSSSSSSTTKHAIKTGSESAKKRSSDQANLGDGENTDANKKQEESVKKMKTEDGSQAMAANPDAPPRPPVAFQLPPDFSVEKIKRSILEDKPRLTRFQIDWGDA